MVGAGITPAGAGGQGFGGLSPPQACAVHSSVRGGAVQHTLAVLLPTAAGTLLPPADPLVLRFYEVVPFGSLAVILKHVVLLKLSDVGSSSLVFKGHMGILSFGKWLLYVLHRPIGPF